MTPQTKQQKVNSLIGELRDIKIQVDAKYQEESVTRERMNNFLAQYQSYLGELVKQAEDFSGKIANAHLQLENLNRLSEPPVIEEQNAQEDLPEQAEFIEPVDTDTPEENKSDEREKKEEIRRHFAGFWHPDRNYSSTAQNNNFMTVLNTAFNKSLDSADLLAAIPWDTAWEQRKSGESLGNHWERLTDWLTDLEIASERLDQKLASVKNDWRYPLFSDWDQVSDKQEFFTDLANNKRDEIRSLESTLQVLLQEIQDMRSDEVG